MKNIFKLFFIITLFILMIPIDVLAGQGCCSRHGGEVGCTGDGRSICGDGTLSPSCRCTPSRIYGCTDRNANNYNPNANTSDGSCRYDKYGCTDKSAKNYDPSANKSNNSCVYYTLGCTNEDAKNYNEKADKDDGSCILPKIGCTDPLAKNYNSEAEIDDNSCEYYITGCTDESAINYDPNAEQDDNTCQYEEKKVNFIDEIDSYDSDYVEEDNKEEEKENDIIGTIASIITLAGLGTGVYYSTKKKEKKSIFNFLKKKPKKNFLDNIFKH